MDTEFHSGLRYYSLCDGSINNIRIVYLIYEYIMTYRRTAVTLKMHNNKNNNYYYCCSCDNIGTSLTLRKRFELMTIVLRDKRTSLKTFFLAHVSLTKTKNENYNKKKTSLSRTTHTHTHIHTHTHTHIKYIIQKSNTPLPPPPPPSLSCRK
jgi:hypothetical protein